MVKDRKNGGTYSKIHELQKQNHVDLFTSQLRPAATTQLWNMGLSYISEKDNLLEPNRFHAIAD